MTSCAICRAERRRRRLRLLVAATLTAALVISAGAGASPASSTGSGHATVFAKAIALGWIHSCTSTSAGGVECWGYNAHAELGDGTTRERWRPVDVSGLSSGVTAITTGARHGCALTSEGVLECWGYNYYGQLGDGTKDNRPTPVHVAGLGTVTAIAGGAFHTCALTSDGRVSCWGFNGRGQLGDGTTTDGSTPVGVSGLSGATAIAAGDSHSCAITQGGGVRCWGDNRYGQLGDGTTQSRSAPVAVSGLPGGVRAVALGGRHSCAITRGGGVKCWGAGGFGQLGDGATGRRLFPVDVSGLSHGVTEIAAGDGHTCVRTVDGAVKCWGYNGWGQLGDGTTVDRRRPVGVSGLGGGVAEVAAGARHTCALTRTGGVMCWGYNYNGQLGDGTPDDHLRPVDVLGLGSAKAKVAVVSRSLHVTPEGVAVIKLRCGVAARCKGALSVSATVRRHSVGPTRPRGTVTLGARRFSIAAGRRASVGVELTARGLELVVRAERLWALARVSYVQPAGNTTATTRRIALVARRR